MDWTNDYDDEYDEEDNQIEIGASKPNVSAQ